jgi:2-dehydro-3-deoxygluconokinase
MVELYADQSIADARTFTKTFGGDSCNAIVAAARLGTSVGYMTRVGDDPFAPFLLRSWAAHGVDTSHCRSTPGFNGLYLISLLPGGEREFTYYRKGSAASCSEPEDLDEDYIAGARWLHVTGVSQAISPSCRSTVLAALKLAKHHGLQTSFDPNLRTRLWSLDDAIGAMEEILPYVDVVLPSLPEEAAAMMGSDDPQWVATYLLDRGPSLIVGKLSADGCFVATREALQRYPAHSPGAIVDSSGAGDAFAGAFIHGMLTTGSPEQAARIAVIASALKLRGRGALESQPSRDDVNRVLVASGAKPLA